MRVLDNLENYDIPSGFHLTADQEEQLAADLKEIVLALIPLRSSKLKTRQYFNSHLRYTSNVKYAQSRPDAPQDRYEFGDSYTPLPGEYTRPMEFWLHSKLHRRRYGPQARPAL